MRGHRYSVYMLTSSSRRALYTGVSNGLEFRKVQHLEAGEDTFVGKYKAYRLVYYEDYQWIQSAIAREKEIKGWTRKKKEALVRSMNPEWKDLSAEWGKPFPLITPFTTKDDKSQTQGPSRHKKGAQDDKAEE